jgi:hypothetical protein
MRGEVRIRLLSYPLIHLTTPGTSAKNLTDSQLHGASELWWNWWTRMVAPVTSRVASAVVRVGAPPQRESPSG